MLAGLRGFDWDAANIAHILRHKVTPFEVEDSTSRPHIVIPARTVDGEKRWKLLGSTTAGRYLVVVFTIRRQLCRVVTAYEMNLKERKQYAQQIGQGIQG